jgi:hypothetical protein
MPDRQSQRTLLFVLIAWFGLACAAGISGKLERVSAPGIAGIVWTLTLLALFAAWKVTPIRDWTMSVAARWLVLFHLTRFVGFYFLFLERRGEMPAAFAVPAGLGDITVAVLAVIILISSAARNRPLLLVWNCLGLIDILLVVSLALRIGLRDWASMHALREWPLSLLPLFVVPLIIASHGLIFVRARRAIDRPD